MHYCVGDAPHFDVQGKEAWISKPHARADWGIKPPGLISWKWFRTSASHFGGSVLKLLGRSRLTLKRDSFAHNIKTPTPGSILAPTIGNYFLSICIF